MAKRSNRAHRLPHIISKLPELKRVIAELRAEKTKKQKKTIALVPTMGALHEGHLSLIRLARRRADTVVVSIFVNPAQFAPHEDFGSYPRTFEADLAALGAERVDLVWAPSVETMYPAGFATKIVPEGPAQAGLEDAFRAHFFTGVATVVAKLLIQCEPDIAIFGEKDYQQLKVITRLACDLDLKTRIVGAPIVREPSGLALSSRNVYLTLHERAAAPLLHGVLTDCAKRIASGEPVAAVLERGRSTISLAGFALDYLEARHADTLAPVASAADGPIRLLVAARIGKTRLIDNLAA
ncbi:MAG TPA: pantoate--beta-alanine ligase [Xanthobacteraceae bacterium]|nr:pantoate--beta-alanine ligase [Xanthobacteraceae bacterium]